MHPSLRFRRPRAAALLALACLAACGRQEQEPRWIELAVDFEPRPLAQVAAIWAQESAGKISVRPVDGSADVWIETTIPRSDWRPFDEDGHWATALPGAGAFHSVSNAETRLVAGGRTFKRPTSAVRSRPGDYLVREGEIFIALGPDARPPVETTYGVRVSNGEAGRDAWRIQYGTLVGNGIPVWSGSSEELIVDLPADSCLRFGTAWTGVGADGGENGGELSVLIDGEVLATVSTNEHSEHVLDLPAAGAEDARLAFEVSGPPGCGLILAPVIAPLDVGTYRQRPWAEAGERRPDIVLFLADTFRADNLKAHGGERGLTPGLDAFAERSVRFLAARATATSTLPSISSLMTGLQPGQHGATRDGFAPARELTTIAEVLARSGYRTGAVTDAGFFSYRQGLDRGFQFFREHPFPDSSLTRTVEDACAFLDRDDGRPVFLVVHTYRTHSPYRRGESEDESDWDALVARALAQAKLTALPTLDERRAVFIEHADALRALYDDGVRALDEQFSRFHTQLEARGILESGNLIFTADHGESFGDNGCLGHGRELWDATLRVPLLVGGRGLAPTDVPWTVSLVDFPATICALTGISAGDWTGGSLLETDSDREVYSFLLRPDVQQVALVLGARKVVAQPDVGALERGEFLRAFDLAQDPGEEQELAAGTAWAEELCRRRARRVEELLTPVAAPTRLDDRFSPALAALGYVSTDPAPAQTVGTRAGATGLSETPDATVAFAAIDRSEDIWHTTGGNLLLAHGRRNDQFGRALASGDVDGDGLLDLVVGAEHAQGVSDQVTRPGSVFVISGERLARLRRGEQADGDPFLHVLSGSTAHNEFGITVATADVDQDGCADVIVGAPMQSPRVRVFSGRTARVLISLTPPKSGLLFGYEVSAADVNGDGRPDLLVGAPADSTRLPRGGAVYVYTTSARQGGQDGVRAELAYTYFGLAENDSLGLGISPLPDLNGDGCDEWLVGAPMVAAMRLELSVFHGEAHLVSGKEGTPLLTLKGAGNDLFGLDSAAAGDADGDGVVDLLIGAPRHDGPAGKDSGLATLYSGASLLTGSGRELYRILGAAPMDTAGHAMAGVGDFDGDGRDDFAVGAKEAHRTGPSAGNVRVFSGRDGALLFERDGDAATEGTYGYALCPLGDLDADGYADFAVSAPHDKRVEPLGGVVEILFGFDPDA